MALGYLLTAAEIAAGVTPTNFEFPPYDARREGVTGSMSVGAATVQTSVLQAAISAAMLASQGESSVLLLPGGLLKTGPLFANRGAQLIGTTSIASGIWTTLIYNDASGTGDLLTWNATAASGGGSIENVQIVAGSSNGYGGGTTTGAALRWIAQSSVLRPTELIVRNVLVEANVGDFGRGLHFDGSAASTAGSTGIRTIVLEKVRASGCSINNEYMRFHWVTHLTGNHVQVDQAGGTGTPGMRFTGTSYNVNIQGLICNGNVLVEDSMTDWHCSGLIGDNLEIGGGCTRVTFEGHVADDVVVAGGASNIGIFGTIGGDLTVGAGATGVFVGRCGGTVTNNASGSFLVINSVDFVSEGTFTGTLTGCTTAPTGTIRYSKTGRMVNLRIPTISGTSNSTACTITGLPSLLVPTQEKNLVGRIENAGTAAFGLVNIEAGTGTIRLGVGVGSGAFSGSGTKGASIMSVAYSLD